MDNWRSVPLGGRLNDGGIISDCDDLHQDAGFDSRNEGAFSVFAVGRQPVGENDHDVRDRRRSAVFGKLEPRHIYGEVRKGAAIGVGR